MRANPTLFAMLILIVTNQIAVLSDAVMKLAGQEAVVFEILLYRQLSTLALLLPWFLFTKDKLPTKPKVHLFRGHLWLVGSMCMVWAIVSLPLATANALFYAAPLMMLPLNYLLFKQKIRLSQGLAAALGFIGVLVIIRPSEFNWGALAALGTALTLALSNLSVKKIPKQESVVTSLMWMNLMTIPATLCLALPHMQGIDWDLLLLVSLSSLFILFLHAGSVVAYKMADANTIASTEYTGLIGAAVVGWLWFSEMPDWLTWFGAALIVLPLVLQGRLGQKLGRSIAKLRAKNSEVVTADTAL